VPVTDPAPVEPSKATDRLAPTSADSAKDPENADSDTDPKGPAQRRKMGAALDDFLRPSQLRLFEAWAAATRRGDRGARRRGWLVARLIRVLVIGRVCCGAAR
jgi:hypothetical protein